MASWSRGAKAIGIALLLGGGACTLLLDRSAAQCHDDSDCARFSGQPLCRNSVCVYSGFQQHCFLGTPQTLEQFLNQCTTNFPAGPTGNECLAFDNCRIDGYCDGGTAANPDAGVTPPPTPDAGSTPDAGVPTKPVLPNCVDAAAGRSSVVYMTGSSNFPPLLQKLAPIINGLTGLTPVFRTTDSCTGARSQYPMFSTADHLIKDPAPGPTAVYAQYFDANGGHDCSVGPGSVEVDVGESEIFPETCGLQRDPDHVGQFPGPILPILFVVPIKSVESSISAEAARQVLGNGGHVFPWTDSSLFFVRGAGTATTRLIGLGINLPVPPNKFWGIDQGSAQKLADNLQLVVDPAPARQAIGILGADFYDTHRANLKALAFQATGQECAYLPDSSLFTRDKINVRDGHYPIWGTLHFFASVVNTTPVSPAAVKFLSPFNLSPVSEDIVDAFIDSSWVPDCAMNVQRNTELGVPGTSNPPPFPCGCHFDARVNGNKALAGCTPCVKDGDCADPQKPSCNLHFCEARSPGL